MANQYLAFYKETTRGTAPGSPTYKFLPITAGLSPKFAPKDEPRKEFRGADTALGDSSAIRRESAWTDTVEAGWYPGEEVGTMLAMTLGKAGSRTVVDTSARRGIIYPVAQPFGSGAPQGDSALALVPNTDEGGTTLSQVYGGGRPSSATISIKQPDDVKISFEFGGPGGYIGAVDEAAVAGVAFPAAAVFLSSDVKCYIGTGAVRTGTAPDFTDLAPGTMVQFSPDDLTLKLTPGMSDKAVINGVAGPSKTTRSGQFSAELDFTIDYDDPASGFSSADEFKKIFDGVTTNSLMIVIDNLELAGAATATYRAVIDLPLMLMVVESPERNNEGQTPQVKFSFKSLFDTAIGYPVAIMTTDKAASY
jgi:hypothetical protein